MTNNTRKNFSLVVVLTSLLLGCNVPSITVNVPEEVATSLDKLQQGVAPAVTEESTALTTTATAAEPEVVVPRIEGAGHVGPTPRPAERENAFAKFSPTPGPSPALCGDADSGFRPCGSPTPRPSSSPSNEGLRAAPGDN